ncbi:MAG: hypothetical protein ABI382_04655 [Nakamurella sp.]
MTVPPDPNQVPDPSAYQPQSGAYIAPPLDGGESTGSWYPPTGQQAGQPGAYPPPGFPAPVPSAKKPGKGRMIGSIIAIVLVVGGGLYGFLRAQSNPQRAQVGDCIYYATESNNKVVNCDSDKAQYQVEARLDSSSDTGCKNFKDTDITLYSKDDTKTPFTLCVSLVLHEGSCVSNDGDVIDCADPSAAVRVTSVHEGSTDPSVCAAGEIPRSYTLRPRVVCLAEIS